MVVISLIGGEIWLGNKQDSVLTQLQGSSASTAATLSSLQTTTEAMNGAIQRQLGLMARGSVDIGYSPADKRLNITNTGATTLTIWDYRFGNERPQMLKQHSKLAPGGTYPIPVGTHFARDSSQPRDLQSFPVSFAVYLKGENETELVAATVLTVAWSVDVLQVTPPPSPWPREDGAVGDSCF